MNRFIVAGVATLLSSFAVASNAQARTYELTPFNLVNLARNGYLVDRGIPASNRLSSAYRQGHLSAEDLIQAAIDDNRTPADVLLDRTYVSAVDNFLRNLDSASNNR